MTTCFFPLILTGEIRDDATVEVDSEISPIFHEISRSVVMKMLSPNLRVLFPQKEMLRWSIVLL